VATGFAGNGLTFGTLAAMIVCDRVLGTGDRYGTLYEATRVKPLAGADHFVTENVDFPLHTLERFFLPRAHSLDELAPGQGATVRVGGEPLAVHRAESGELEVLSAVCTHLGCIVHWNGAEQTWDCPCHGSSYSADGEVIRGPATVALRRKTLPRAA
jgi:nitrite reductase/ring-hydroxylating ferredoxin subunit